MSKLSQDAKNRIIISLTDKKVGEEVIAILEKEPFKNFYTLYVDAQGDDTGDGSITSPYKTLSKAMDQCTDQSNKYTIILGSGTYNGPTLNWLGNVSCFSYGSSYIQQTLQYTAIDGAEEAFIFNGINVSNFQMDLTQTTGYSLPVLTNGSYSITRTDATAGAQFIQVSDSSINLLDLRGALSASNVIFLGQVDVRAGGNLLLDACVFGASATMYDDASATVIASVFTGSFNGPATSSVKTDATSMLYGGTVTGCETILIDNSNFLGYTPADSNLWNVPAPKNVKDAIDRIAVAVTDMLGGPI